VTSIDENLTQSDIDDAKEAIRTLLQEQDPTLDLSNGGPVDSLLVDGTSLVAAQNDADVDRAFLLQSLQAIASGTVTVEDEDLENLMEAYFLARKEAVPATGDVEFIVSEDRVYTIPAGFTIRFGDQAYEVTQTFTVSPDGTTGVDFSDETNIRLQDIFDEETGFGHRFVIPFSSVESVPEAIRTAGDRFTPDQGFSGLGPIEAAENFQGGTAEETNAEFASRGLTGVLAETVGGRDNINKIVGQAVQNAVSNTVGINDPLMTRDRNNVFNLPVGGKIDVYAKSGAIGQEAFQVDAEVVDVGARRLKVRLTREESAGVYRAVVAGFFVSSPPGGITGEITIESIEHFAATVDGFNPEMPTEIERAFSANQEIEITFTDTRVDSLLNPIVTLSFVGETISGAYQAETQFQPGILSAADALSADDDVRPPGLDVLVKAAVPCITNISVVAQTPEDYSGPDEESLQLSIVSAVNLLPVTRASLDAFTISTIVQNAAPDLTVSSVTMTGTVFGQDDTDISIPQTSSKLQIPLNTTAKVGPANTYFTTTFDKVTVTFV